MSLKFRIAETLAQEAEGSKLFRGSTNTAAFSRNSISTVALEMVLKQPVETCEGLCSEPSSLRPSQSSPIEYLLSQLLSAAEVVDHAAQASGLAPQ